MTIARANGRAVKGSTVRSIAPSRKCTCQSSGRRIVIVSGLSAMFAPSQNSHIRIERGAAACYGRRRQMVEIMMTGCIVGWAHSKFGKHDGRDVESLIVEVAEGALADAGVAAADIDSIYLGTMNGGFVNQEFPASLVFQADPGFRFKPATRVENACATGSAAIHMGLNTIAAGKARLVLVVGVEKMTEVSGAVVNDLLLRASYRKEEDQIE